MDIQSVIERVARLRALSTSKEVHEAVAAAAIADKLISEWQLTEADLELTGQKQAETVQVSKDPRIHCIRHIGLPLGSVTLFMYLQIIMVVS